MDYQLVKRLQREIEAQYEDIIALRHALHREPELALQETQTRAKILQALDGTSLQLWEPLLGTDVIAELPGRSPRAICLRADIDAIPVQEMTGLDYASCIPGRMHACGHDGHTAMLVGAARVLDRLRDALPFTVRFIFQPGEEVVAAGKTLVELGACRDAEAAYALHGWAGLPLGSVCSCPGVMFAAGSMFSITVQGKGGHGAHPEKGNNPIPIAARIVERLLAQHVKINAETKSVITVCAFQSGASGNVIPETATLQGTSRYLDIASGDEIEQAIRTIAIETAADAGATVDIVYTRSYGLPVVNTMAGYEAVRGISKAVLPAGHWIEMSVPTMGNEDFAYYLTGREGAMFFLGNGMDSPQVHTPFYNFNDEIIPVGMLMHCLLGLMGIG